MIDGHDSVKTFAFHELLNHPRKPESTIISEGLFKVGSMLVIGGAPKAYKSFAMLALAVSTATGRNLFGAHRSPHGRPEKVFVVDRPRRVILFEQEVGEDDLEDRLTPFYNSLLPHEQELFRRNFHSHSLDSDLRLDMKEGMQLIEQHIVGAQAEIAMYDPLIEFHNQEENSPTAMSAMLKNLTSVSRRTKSSPILSHHESKPSANGDNGRAGGDRLRGASSLYGKADTILNLTVINRNAMRIRVDFTLRRGKPIKSMILKVDPVTLEPKFLCWEGDKLWKKMVSPLIDEDDEMKVMTVASGALQ